MPTNLWTLLIDRSRTEQFQKIVYYDYNSIYLNRCAFRQKVIDFNGFVTYFPEIIDRIEFIRRGQTDATQFCVFIHHIWQGNVCHCSIFNTKTTDKLNNSMFNGRNFVVISKKNGLMNWCGSQFLLKINANSKLYATRFTIWTIWQANNKILTMNTQQSSFDWSDSSWLQF